jgi:hypothetical protein
LLVLRDKEHEQYGMTMLNLLDLCSRAKPLEGLAGIVENKNQTRRRIEMIGAFKKMSIRGGIIAVVAAGILSIFFLTDANAANEEANKNGDNGKASENSPKDAQAKPVVQRHEITVDPKIYDDYIGKYKLGYNFIVTVTRDGNHLFAQATGQKKFEIYPETEKDFFYRVVNAQITFVRDAKGKVTQLVLHQNGDHTAEKGDWAEIKHTEVKVDPKIYDGYIGKYQLSPSFIITITCEGNHLFAQATGQMKFEIYPESETNFFYKVVDAQILFTRDANGKATQLILHQGGADFPPAKKMD